VASIRAVAVATLALVVGGMTVVPAGAGSPAQPQGVTDDEILVVVLASDLDGLRARGFNLAPKLTTANLMKRWEGLTAEVGKINGRTLRFEPVVWDPLDTTTFDRACTEAVQDKKPFLVVNGSGYRASSVACITVDGDTPMFAGDPVYAELQEASGKNLVSLGVPAEVSGEVAADVARATKLVPRTAKIGILAGNEPANKAAGDALEARLLKRGYDVVEKVELNTLQGDTTITAREATAAVGVFSAAGVDTVFITQPFVTSQAYFQEATRSNAGFQTFIVDASAGTCTQFAASRVPLDAAGSPCVTTWDTRAVPTKDGVEQDSEFEAECRAIWNKSFGEQSQPGVPTGDITAGGITYTGDMSPNECTMMSLLAPAIKKAGRNLTWEKVHANLMKTTDSPVAYFSDGQGGFGKNKAYFAKYVHLQVLTPVSADTPKDPNGVTFNGCPAPANCWVPQLIDGEEWFPISTK
jgi:hypothetical protein